MIIQANQISPNLNDTDSLDRIGVSVPYAKDGNISNCVLDTTKDCAVQRETGSSIVYTEAEARQLNKMNGMELPDDSFLSPADFISRCMTGEDAQALSDEETPLEEYTSSQLERAVVRVKEQRSEKEQAIEAEVSKQREKQEAIEESTMRKAEKALEQMQQGAIPVNAENTARLSTAINMTMALENFSQASMKFFIGNEMSVTPENINSSYYGSSSRGGQSVASSDFSEIQTQVEEILTDAGMEVNEENIDVAKWLYENQLPVTPENIKTYQSIEELKNLDLDTLIARIADDMMDGMSPEKADLLKLSVQEAKDSIREFVATDDATIKKVYPKEIEFLSAKRRMEEIRLSMTVEAARAMSAKGIQLDIKNLQEIVEELQVQEQKAKDSILLENDLPVNESNRTMLSDTLDAAKKVLASPVEWMATTQERGMQQTLAEASETADALTEQYRKAGQSYEAVGTEVRRDLGDSMTKAFRNVDDILVDLNLEVTGMNQRAVRILAYNQMPLTEETILQMKEYDSRVRNLMEQLQPAVVSQLVKNKVNPLQMSLEELAEEVKQVQKEVVPEETSFRDFLWKMDHQGGLTEEERQSMIGIYRLLDKVEKSDGAVIGQVIKEGKELSFASLLSAVRTRKAEGMDVQVDDGFGGLENVVTKGSSISDQIQAAYADTLISELKGSLSPKVLRELGVDGMELSLEAFLEKCMEDGETAEDMAEYYADMAERLKKAFDDPAGEVGEFLKAVNLPDSAVNRNMVKHYMEHGFSQYRNLFTEEESEELTEAFDEPDTLDDLYEKLDTNHQEILEKQKENDDITYDDIQTIMEMAKSISFYKSLRTYQTYEVPIFTNEGILSCNITIQSGNSKEKGTVEVVMNSEELGEVQATFKVNGKRVKGFVTAENASGVERMTDVLAKFEKDLEENGYTMDSENLVKGKRSSLHTGNRAEGTKNRDLYQVAKLFIQNVSGKDDEV